MASNAEIADRALLLATRFLDSSRSEIEAMADGDPRRLYEAAQIVRSRAGDGAHAVHSAEHLAFSLITAAHEQLRRHAQHSGPEPG